MKLCKKCGKQYSGQPAVSRVDGSDICAWCGYKEALDEAVEAGIIEEGVVEETLVLLNDVQEKLESKD